MTKDEALRMALETLEQLHGIDTETECVTIDVGDVIDAIEEALAQPEQGPVAYDKTEMNCFVQDLYDKKMLEGKHGHYETMFHVVHQAIKKVPPQRTWVEPTDEEINLLAKAYSTMEGELNAPAFARAILRKAQE